MKYTLIYGTTKHTPELLEAARAAALKCHPLAAANCGLVVLDRYGIEQEVMNTCAMFKIPLVVVGTMARPRTGVSMRQYERAILTMQEHQDREAQLRRYVVNKAANVIILGDSPDCLAMRTYMTVIRKQSRHSPTLAYTVPSAPDTDWIRKFGHYYQEVT